MPENLPEHLDENALVPLPPESPGHTRAASFLHTNHGPDALAEAVRHGMLAQQRGDEPATAFWCGVCSLLVHMRQAGTTAASPEETFQWPRRPNHLPWGV